MLSTGNTLNNQAGGRIVGFQAVSVSGAATIVNAGTLGLASGDSGAWVIGAANVTNVSGGRIAGRAAVAGLGVGGTVDNAGTIAGSGFGVYLRGGDVTNRTGGSIGGGTGVMIQGYEGSVDNAGSIAGNSAGVLLTRGGAVTNRAGGAISGNYAILLTSHPATIANAGILAGNVVGIALFGDGTVSNSSGGTISGQNAINVVVGAATISNDGLLTGRDQGLALFVPNGFVTNGTGGTIKGAAGIGFFSGGGNVVNAGTILGTAASGNGANLTNDSQLINLAGGLIAGFDAVVASDASTIVNAGTLGLASNDAGVWLLGAANVTNQSGGRIGGRDGIAALGGGGTVDNAGTIANTDLGVYLRFGGTLTNRAGGSVSAATGVDMHAGAATVENAGTVAGTTAALRFAAGFTNRLIVDPGAVFSGLVEGGNTIGATAVSTLEMASGASAGTLSGLGSQFLHFTQTAIDANAYWVLTGANTFVAGGSVTNSGTLLNAGTLAGTGYGLDLTGGSFTNRSGGLVSGVNGATIHSGAATVVNAGSIAGSSAANGIVLSGSNVLINQSGGRISGFNAVRANGAATVSNAGTLGTASGDKGVAFFAVGNLTNESGGQIAGRDGVAMYGGSGTATNAGTIAGTDFGVYFAHNGTFTNQSAGSVSAHHGIYVASGSAIVENAGSVSGSIDAVHFAAGSDNRLILDPGSALSGLVEGGNTIGATAVSTLELASGATAGTISGIGSQFVHFAQTTIDTNAYWELAGTNTFVLGGSVVNSGTIINAGTAVGAVRTGGVLINGTAGTIAGSGYGLDLTGGSFTNRSGGLVTATNGAIVRAGAATVVNAGSIAGLLAANGIVLSDSNVLVNQSSGRIAGYNAVRANGAATVVNAGTLGIAASDKGAAFFAVGNLTNQSGGQIAGRDGVVFYGSSGTATNAGTIAGRDFGAYFSHGGVFTNQAGGLASAHHGIYVASGSATVENAGSVFGDIDAVHFAAGSDNRLILDPGFALSGLVEGGNTIGATAVSTLELASGASAGTIANLGAQFVHFAQTTIDTGASWTLTGSNTQAAGTTLTNSGTLTLLNATLTDAGSFQNDGVVVIDPSSLTVADAIGTGSITIAADSTLEVQGTVASGETIVLSGTNAVLRLDNPTAMAGTIAGFALGGTIDLAGVDPDSIVYNDGLLNFALTGGGSGSIHMPVGNALIYPSSNGAGGAGVTLCFLSGTKIATPAGDVFVEQLAIGDTVRTARGGTSRITWIGEGRVLATQGQRSAATPVIVRRGALEANVPYYDLRVTKGHAFWIDDVLIPVEFLINHRSILWDDRAREVHLYHVELESHDILLANGAPAESYRDDGNRWLFQNANSGWGLPPQEPCAPVLTGGAIVDAVWRRLLDRAGDRPALPLTEDADLHLSVDGQRLDPLSMHDGLYAFQLRRRPTDLRVVSRETTPTEIGLSRDARSLGVAIRQIRLWSGPNVTILDANDPSLTDGFHAFEPDNGFRWTNGDAVLPTTLFGAAAKFPCELEIQTGGTMRYLLWKDRAA
ncbi:MAG: Hint domain-containing protein [Rhodospirillales bacterium]